MVTFFDQWACVKDTPLAEWGVNCCLPKGVSLHFCAAPFTFARLNDCVRNTFECSLLAHQKVVPPKLDQPNQFCCPCLYHHLIKGTVSVVHCAWRITVAVHNYSIHTHCKHGSCQVQTSYFLYFVTSGWWYCNFYCKDNGAPKNNGSAPWETTK